MKTATGKPEDFINLRFVFGFTLGLMGMYLFAFIINHIVYKRNITESCQSAFVSSFPDMAFMGIPIFMVIFGEQSLVSIVIGNIITSFIMIPITVFVLELSQPAEKRQSIVILMLKVFKKPLVLAPLFGMIISLLQIQVPTIALSTFKLFGSATSPVSLFALGLIISGDKILINRYVMLNIFKKNILHPLLMFGIVLLFGIKGEWAMMAILLCAMPPAIMTTMFATKYDVLKLESSSSTVLGTVV